MNAKSISLFTEIRWGLNLSMEHIHAIIDDTTGVPIM